MNKCCASLFNEAKQEISRKDKRIAFLETEITRVFDPTRKFWNETNHDELTKLKQRLTEAEKVVAMVADNTLMPHKHSEPQLRLYCLAERANEYQQKYGEHK